MTILCTDLKMLAADSQTTAGAVKVYKRTKIRILKQHAIATAGDENEGFQFEKWFFAQQGESFIGSDDFQVIILNKDTVLLGEIKEGTNELAKLWNPLSKVAMGAETAAAAAEALMRTAKFNAHDAAVAAANYHIYCGEPVYSISRAQLNHIHQDFDGYWIGTYKTPITKLEEYLITPKQWLKT